MDAYDGTMNYVSDPEDPLLRTWGRIFTTAIPPPVGDARGPERPPPIPQDLFNIRARSTGPIMTDANTFYNKEDVWDRINTREQGKGAWTPTT